MSEATLKSENPRYTARARVQVIVEVYCAQPWSLEATLAELLRTAEREALDLVTRKLAGTAIIGTPRVVAMFTAEGGLYDR